MIKKISAIVLALVLCLSVVVMPVSAYELASGSEVAYIIELDKDSYSAGETVTVNLYLYGKSGLEFGTGAIVIGMNSALFDTAENDINDVKAGSTCSDLMASYYKDSTGSSWAWQTNATVLSNISSGNTAEENAMFDQYIKFTLARNTAGTHDNAGSNKNGLPTDEINADSDAGVAFVSFSLKLRDDIADGTAINLGVPSGAMPKNYTYMNYYKDPGTLTTVVKTTAATSEIVNSTTATIGAAGLAVSYWKDQIRFQEDDAGKYANKFDYRILATIDGFADIFDDVADAKDTSDNDGILEAGFIFSKSGTVDKDTAIAQINGGAATYSAVTNAYVSTSFGGKEYVMACYVGNIADADVDTALSALGYVKYMVDGKTEVATFDAAQTSTFRTLYDKNASNKPA